MKAGGFKCFSEYKSGRQMGISEMIGMLETPESIKSHSGDYHYKSWTNYELSELGMWVHLLVKRAMHRSTKEKALKDLQDAQNYLNMMQEHINAAINVLDKMP